jgi:hypothetical protein
MIEEIQASRKPKDSIPEESAAVEASDVAGSEQGAAQEKTEEKVKEKLSDSRDWKRNGTPFPLLDYLVFNQSCRRALAGLARFKAGSSSEKG